jgi:hypothetical protein
MRVGGRGAIDNKRTLYFNHNTWEKLNQALLFCIEKKKKLRAKDAELSPRTAELAK